MGCVEQTPASSSRPLEVTTSAMAVFVVLLTTLLGLHVTLVQGQGKLASLTPFTTNTWTHISNGHYSAWDILVYHFHVLQPVPLIQYMCYLTLMVPSTSFLHMKGILMRPKPGAHHTLMVMVYCLHPKLLQNLLFSKRVAFSNAITMRESNCIEFSFSGQLGLW